VYLPNDEEVLGKKAVFKLLQNDEGAMENFKDLCTLPEESDLAFNSRVLKLITSLPFEDEREKSGNPTPQKASTPRNRVTAPSPEKEKTPVAILKAPGPKKELVSKMSLAKLVARRRLDGGEFSYVYLPLEKVIAGKKSSL